MAIDRRVLLAGGAVAAVVVVGVLVLRGTSSSSGSSGTSTNGQVPASSSAIGSGGGATSYPGLSGLPTLGSDGINSLIGVNHQYGYFNPSVFQSTIDVGGPATVSGGVGMAGTNVSLLPGASQ